MIWKQRLKQARENSPLYKKKVRFAEAMGVSAATVTDWEKDVDSGGIEAMKASNLIKACKLLGVTSSWLLGGKDNNIEPHPIPLPQKFSKEAEDIARKFEQLSTENKKSVTTGIEFLLMTQTPEKKQANGG